MRVILWKKILIFEKYKDDSTPYVKIELNEKLDTFWRVSLLPHLPIFSSLAQVFSLFISSYTMCKPTRQFTMFSNYEFNTEAWNVFSRKNNNVQRK